MAVEYRVDYENKKVFAILKDTKYDCLFNIMKLMRNSNFRFQNEARLYLKKQYVGVARCHEQDIFDVNVGKEIAKSKCLSLYYKDKDSMMKKFYSEIVVGINRVQKHIKTVERYDTAKNSILVQQVLLAKENLRKAEEHFNSLK